jgi:hypothetical protein
MCVCRSDRSFDAHGDLYQVAGYFIAAFLSILIAVYWDTIIPRRWQAPRKQLEYLTHIDSELGEAVRQMVWRSAWAKWYSAQLLVNTGKPASESDILHPASHLVTENLINGDLEVRGRLPGKMDYAPIPRTHWRSSGLHFVPDPRSLWRMVIFPTGGAEFTPEGTVIAHDAIAGQRTATMLTYDSLIIDGFQFEKLWPKREPVADKKRRQLLRQALKRGFDKNEILKLSGARANWQLHLLRFGLGRLAGL